MRSNAAEVFLIEGDRVRALPARPFRAGLFGATLEAALQTLIERHPTVLPGAQMDPGGDDPPRFFLLRREMPLGGWSVDHLLVDQQGVPTLVETKLAENPEARREVIGQVLDYAAGAVAAWAGGRARELAGDYWQRQGRALDEALAAWLPSEGSVDALWAAFDEHLRRGRLRLVIVGDRLTPEVRRVIEYLNQEMATAEVFGLELPCFGDEGHGLVLVPQLVGQSQAVADRKSGEGPVPLWTPERLREAYAALDDRPTAARLSTILDWATASGRFLDARAKNPVFGLAGRQGDRVFTFFRDGTPYWFMSERFYAGGAAERDALLARLRALRLLDDSVDPRSVTSGRNLRRRLADLSDQEFADFRSVLAEASGARQP